MRLKKCAFCLIKKKCPYKKGEKHFCSKEHKKKYYENDIPTLKKEIQVEFNRMVTKGQPCAYCGKRFAKMDCSHVFSRESADHLRFDILNVLPMDSKCHKWVWHSDPIIATNWFKSKYPERWDYLMFAKSQSKEWTVEELKQIREDIKNRNLKGLIRFYKDYYISGKAHSIEDL